MNLENKKISFGFNKLIKKQNILPHLTKTDKSVELIECVESNEIKVKNPIEKVEKGPLVITIKGNSNELVDRIKKESLKNRKIEINEEDTRTDSELTIEELAARQLLREARNRLTKEKDTTKVHFLPLTIEKVVVEDGQEPSIEDYDSVPITDYGLAMLRGMGWTEGMSIGKNQSKSVKPIEPELRPKGLGLGAQKMVESNPKDLFDKNGKQLILMKGAFAKIIAGTHKGTYCEVQGLDDDSGRIIIKSNKNEILTLNELFVTPVTKEDYLLGSKIINNVKYERYKDNITKKKSSHNSMSEDEEFKKNEEKSYKSSFNRQNIKTEKEDSTDEIKTPERKKKYLPSSSKDKYDKKKSQVILKVEDENQSSLRSKSIEKKHSSRNYTPEKKRIYSSEENSSDDAYDSRKKIFKYNKTHNFNPDISSSSNEDKCRTNKSKKYKKHEDVTYSKYGSRKLKTDGAREKNKRKSNKNSKLKTDSSSDRSEKFQKYKNRKQ